MIAHVHMFGWWDGSILLQWTRADLGGALGAEASPSKILP